MFDELGNSGGDLAALDELSSSGLPGSVQLGDRGLAGGVAEHPVTARLHPMRSQVRLAP